MARRNTNYRKIWESHYGPIPKDITGRSLEIHHIDGDHTNNSIDNLKLVTLEEHYDLHRAQEDWGACYALSLRLKKSPEEISYLAKQSALVRSKQGTLPAQQAAKTGTHHWSGVNNGFLAKRAKNGTHPSQIAVKNGTHNWQSNANNNQKMLTAGTHPSQIKVSCLCCSRTTSINSFVRNHVKQPCKPSI